MSYKQLLTIILLFISAISNAQNSIFGSVVDENSKPLVGASVYIPDYNKGTVTDKNGKYIISGIPNGKVNVSYSFIGYSNVIEIINFEGNSIERNIKLVQTPIQTEAIVVSGGYRSSQHQNAVKIDVLKLKEQQEIVTPNFAKALTTISGVDMISKGNGVTKPVIRGLSMNDILILNNGVRFENYQYSNHHPLGIDEFGVETVEVIKGSASLLYGADAIGGVINFIKEQPAPVGKVLGDYNFQYHTNSYGVVNNVGFKGATDKFLGGLRFGQKSHADYLQGGGDFVPNSRFNEYSLKTNFGFVGHNSTVKFNYDYNSQSLGLVEEEAVEAILKRGRQNDIFYQRLNSHLFASEAKIFLGKSRVELNASYQNTELTHFGEKDEYELQMYLGTLIYDTKFFVPAISNTDFILGFQGINQKNQNINGRETILLPDANSNSYSGFLFAQRAFIEKIKVQAGVRFDYKSISSESVEIESNSDYRPKLSKDYCSFSGSIGGTYRLTPDLLFRINGATAFRNPNLAELTSNGPHEERYELGDVNLSPEKSFELDFSMHYHTDNFLFDIAAFSNWINDYIFIAPTGISSPEGLGIYQYTQKNSVLYGGEVGMQVHPLGADGFHICSSYSFVVGKQSNGDYLPFIPAQRINLDLSFKRSRALFFDNAFVSVQPSYTFSQNHIALEESKTDGYGLIDISMGGSVGVKTINVQLVIGVNNLLDMKYIDHLSTLKEVELYNSGRNISFTMKVPFEI